MQKITHDTKLVGNISELSVQLYMTKIGIQVSIPYGDRSKYDQIWDVNGKLLKIQVKHARITKTGALEVNCHRKRRDHGQFICAKYDCLDVDAFATIYNNKCYYIPIDSCNTSFSLRFSPTKSNMKLNCNWASDYEVEKQLKLISK